MSAQYSDGGPRDYADSLAEMLRVALHVDVPAFFRAAFVREAKRLGPANYDDFGSLILLECCELVSAGQTIDHTLLRRVLDRVRHRLARSLRRERALGTAVEAVQSEGPPTDARLESFKGFLKSLSAFHAMLFELRYMQGQPVTALSSQFNVSQATVYRRLAEIRDAYRRFVSEEQS